MLQVGELSDVPYVNVKMSASRRNVLRGMHYEIEPCRQAKIVRVCSGAVIEVALDVRNGDLYEATVDAVASVAFYIPEGFAHGYRALTDDAVVVYLCTNQYLPECARAFSPLFDSVETFSWGVGIDDLLLSDKDRLAEPFTFPPGARHFRSAGSSWQQVASSRCVTTGR